jgi:tetratricopeptide (TPR) repeat protein
MNKNITYFIAITVIIALTVIMNSELISYRNKELAFNLDVLSRNDTDMKSLGLISRFLIIKKRIDRRSETEDDYIIELKLQKILGTIYESEKIEDKGRDDSPENNIRPVEKLAKLYLRIIRTLLNKDMPEDLYISYNDPLIELSYFYERFRNYKKALEIMSDIQKRRSNISDYTRRLILLHSGFCHSILSEYKLAEKSYVMIMNLYPESEEAEVAGILLGFIESVDSGSDTIIKQSIPIEDKAEKLYFISAYNQSYKLYGDYLNSADKNSANYIKSKFYHGRSAEELGYYNAAIEDYDYIIRDSMNTKFAKLANQRLMLLGSFYQKDEKLARRAKINSTRLGDDKFFKRVGDIQKRSAAEKFSEKDALKNYNEFVSDSKERNTADIQDKKQEKTAVRELPAQDKRLSNKIFSISVDYFIKGETAKLKWMASIQSTDGFTFEGEILREDTSVITIKTEFGEVPIKKRLIGTIRRYQQ